MLKEDKLQFEIQKEKIGSKNNPFRAVKGKVPTATEMAAWPHDKWMDVLRFLLFFIEKDKETNNESFKFTDDKRHVLDEFLEIPNHPFQEFMYRIDKWLGEASNNDYRYKFQAFSRIVLSYIKKHPSLVDENMNIILKDYPQRLGWAKGQYTTGETRAGTIVERDTAADNATPVKMPSLQAKMMNSLVLLTDMYETIAESVAGKDIKQMKLSEKMKALKDLSFVFTVAGKKQGSNHLTQININTKDPKAIEEGMLDFIKKSQE